MAEIAWYRDGRQGITGVQFKDGIEVTGANRQRVAA